MNRLGFGKKIKYPPYFDRLIFLGATIYLIIVSTWLYRQYRQSVITNNQNLLERNSNPNQEIEEDNNLLLESPSNLNPTEISPLPSPLNNTPPEISALPIPTPPPLPNAVDLPLPPLLESNITIPDQNPQSLPAPPPPTPITPSRPETVPVLNGDNLPPPPLNPSGENVATNTTVNSQKKNALVGVIQLPDGGGFALFNIDNITERVGVGSAIASTGWTLGSIYDNEVIINRNNQSLTLRVGESF
ncbi:hypothetical protein IQ215_06275 [Cyanobacterium stanieri LEGE 03274]|uniref:Type II secretion system protein GspC N-terminal domain-containing protein n=1 Tax=Cyanobacterium stanieri LEGE 03274 TaxID=1828756 RepID=A0ABR9V333_9CHRO|nr:hypothetical protein [Cyanobacterium stanieri]MBE9222299.1 hypothetical protein [Cyanobacterium stanieri LEGE 03274]